MNTAGENNDSEESPLTSSSDTTNTYLHLANRSYLVPPQISLTIPTESSHTLKLVEEGPKSCLKSKKNMTNQQQQVAEDRRRNTIFIPVDRLQDKEKAAMGYQRSKNRRLKTNQEKVYMFLEHPAGWAGFFYHISV